MWKGLLECHSCLLLVLFCALVMQLYIWWVGDLFLIWTFLNPLSSFSFLFLIYLTSPLLFEQACYDFARITTTIIDEEIIPVENTIRSITCILEHNDKETTVFRYTTFVQLLHLFS